MEQLEPTSELSDHYEGVEILLPRGDKMERDHSVAWSHNASESIMGRVCTNPILDTSMYKVEFAGGKVTELTPNPDDCGTPTADLLTVKLFLNSMISTPNADFINMDNKNF